MIRRTCAFVFLYFLFFFSLVRKGTTALLIVLVAFSILLINLPTITQLLLLWLSPPLLSRLAFVFVLPLLPWSY